MWASCVGPGNSRVEMTVIITRSRIAIAQELYIDLSYTLMPFVAPFWVKYCALVSINEITAVSTKTGHVSSRTLPIERMIDTIGTSSGSRVESVVRKLGLFSMHPFQHCITDENRSYYVVTSRHYC